MIALVFFLATSPLPAGRYQLDLELTASSALPLIGDVVTQTVSLVDVDDAGDAVEDICSIVSTGTGHRVIASARAVASLPRQRSRIFVDAAGALVADPPSMRFGDGDDDRDGAQGIAMDLIVDGIGRFTLQVQSNGRALLRGKRTPAGAVGRVEVVESQQRILSGLPFVVEGSAEVKSALFRLRRVADAAGCP